MTTQTINIDHERLRDAGYKKFPALTKPHCIALWQKTFSDNVGIKYHIDIFECPAVPNMNYNYVDYVPCVSFETSLGMIEINQSLFANSDLVSIEYFFDNLWKFTNAKYKEYYTNNI
jgi:hypothetical protein